MVLFYKAFINLVFTVLLFRRIYYTFINCARDLNMIIPFLLDLYVLTYIDLYIFDICYGKCNKIGNDTYFRAVMYNVLSNWEI